MCHTNCCSKKEGKCTMSMINLLLIVGGLNWGLIGLSMLMGKLDAWNLVNMLLGSWPSVEAIVYLLVGIVAVMAVFRGCKCKKCVDGVCVDSAPQNKNEDQTETSM